MNADDCRDYMLAFLFLRYLSDNYEAAAKKELGRDYPAIPAGDTLTNGWDFLRETNPAKMPKFDAVVANPPFSYRWEPNEDMGDDVRFKNHGLAPKSAADFAFLLHGFHYLADQGVMAIILPHGVLFRGGAEERIAEEGYNLNISRYISTAVAEPEIDLAATHRELADIEQAIRKATAKHNQFLKELGLPALP